jgi:hypothetical protein
VFQLSRAEFDEVVANCDHLQRLKFSPTMPFAFTEHQAGRHPRDRAEQESPMNKVFQRAESGNYLICLCERRR